MNYYHKEFEWGEIVIEKIANTDNYYLSRLDMTSQDTQELNQITNAHVRTQWLASRYNLKKLSKENRTLYLKKSSKGKPSFTNLDSHFSISHSRDYVAVIYSKTKKVAIDLEVFGTRIGRLKTKFINKQDFEQGDDIQNLTIIWSAKECIYKYCENPKLAFFKQEISITKKKKSDLLYSILSEPTQNAKLNYQVFDELVLTYMLEAK